MILPKKASASAISASAGASSRRVDDRHRPRGLANERESPIVHGAEREQASWRSPDRLARVVVKWLCRDFATRKKTFRKVLALKNARGKMAAVASTTSLSVVDVQRAIAKRRSPRRHVALRVRAPQASAFLENGCVLRSGSPAVIQKSRGGPNADDYPSSERRGW